MRIRPGKPWPLGATITPAGVQFSVFSSSAESVDVCLFDAHGALAHAHRLARTGNHHHATVPSVAAGDLYAFRVHGPRDPAQGVLNDASLFLLDPYAKSIDTRGGPPRSVVVDDAFDWRGDARPDVAWDDTVIYELHVKGFTMRHPGVPRALRGTYAGLGSDAAIAHLKKLGVTTVELLPVHEIADERPLLARGLKNYWGYSTIGYFAPAGRYASDGRRGEQVVEFKSMVRALHAAGIEVLLDVVYNHTAEGGADGPTLAFKGLDNRAYYRRGEGDAFRYEDVTGCGNSVDLRHPDVLRLVMDSLRYWVVEMHVDGFRFDLAPTLARGDDGFDPRGAFLAAVHQDPILARTKLIAEPWDLGPGGYRLGQFPRGWSEWNDRFRDAARRFWLGGGVELGEVAARVGGSEDLFGDRAPRASVNFVTAHDGFTLRDLTQYATKHNEANGEGNRDGTDNNSSNNHGVEGDTDDPLILAQRALSQRALFATLVLARGVPMITAGDEIGNTQRGNNNAYCQDNETSWLDWLLDDEREAMLAFAQTALAARRSVPALRAEHRVRTTRVDAANGALVLLFESKRDAAILAANPTGAPLALTVDAIAKGPWRMVLDSAAVAGKPATQGPDVHVAPRSIVLLRRVKPSRESTDGHDAELESSPESEPPPSDGPLSIAPASLRKP